VKKALGELLLEAGVIDDDALREGLARQRGRGIRLEQALLELGHLNEVDLTRVLARQQGMPFVDLRKGSISRAIIDRIPSEVALTQVVLPLLERDGKLIVAIDDPLKRIVAEELEFLLGTPISCALAAPKALAEAIEREYGSSETARGGVAAPHEGAVFAGDANDGDDAPIVRLVGKLLRDALIARASDIHVESHAGRVLVRLRIDGVLREFAEHPVHLSAPLISRLKIMARLDIAEKRKPQDGRIEVEIDGRPIDIRVSVLPGSHGESVVLRILDRSAALLDLAQLGFGEEDRKWFDSVIRRPNGIVLVTGPTGSGKTTTLYAALSQLNRPDVKIITAEDPVEYHVPGINQVQVNRRFGLSFSRILRSMLRCAPNMILVGEIRDQETANVAIQASLTGHLVFSTLHTNDATSALTRLADIGVKPFLVSTAVQAVIAQRLARRLCSKCREAYQPTTQELELLGLTLVDDGRPFYRAKGCEACEGSGYRGRLGLFELFEMDAALRELVYRGTSLMDIRSLALDSGCLRSLLADGAKKVQAGFTSASEVLRVAGTETKRGTGI
jgi:type IV pilus assembly protein PilB